MADVDELQQMILTFRVSELHMLLGFGGRNKNGKKNELQSRAIELLRLKSPIINHKIESLYRSLQLQLQSPPTLNVVGGIPDTNIQIAEKAPETAAMQPQQQRGYHYSRAAPMYAPNMYQQQYNASANKPPPQYPIHPDVKFKILPFYDVVNELLKPSSLVPQGSQRQQECSFGFHLTPQQANAIGSSRDTRPGSRIEYLTQVQLRFCLLETTSEQEDCFPPGIMVKINGKVCPLPNPIPTNKAGVEPKRPPRPVNITALVKLSPIVANVVQVQWSTDYTRGYVLAVYLVHKKTSDDLLNRLKSRGVRVADYTRGMIKEKLREDSDSEIATTSLRVSLVCPLGKMRMVTPCRASTCEHFQCFDASLYLLMNEKKPTWMCPVCDKPALYDRLVIDGYFQEVLASAILPSDSREIQLNMDGSWSVHEVKKEQSCVIEKTEPATVKAEPKVEVNTTVSKQEEADVQVVTLSDSDDEPLVSQKRSCAISAPHISSSDSAVRSNSGVIPQSHSPSLIILDSDSPASSPGPPAHMFNNNRNFASSTPYFDDLTYPRI